MMTGEFGLTEEKPGALKFLYEVLNMFDRITSGWFYWAYDRGSWGLEDENGRELSKAGVLVRPYPRKIAGMNPSFSWQPEKHIFSLAFTSPEAKDQLLPTEVYLPVRAWPGGWELKNHGIEISYSFDPSGNILSINPQGTGKISISIQPVS